MDSGNMVCFLGGVVATLSCLSSALLISATAATQDVPLVISTWPFLDAIRVSWREIEQGASAVDAVVEGCSKCEELQCDGSVGYGGSPDENGETTLDAMVMDGTTMDVGAVGALRFVKDAVRAARLVLHHTDHSLLVGDQASAFAISMGLSGPADLTTEDSVRKWSAWADSSCQPNFWRNVRPDSRMFCGPYQLKARVNADREQTCRVGNNLFAWKGIGRSNHDTISMAAIDKSRNIAVATSTNGATFKIPGRVGDGPVVGAGAYADSDVGACGATGDGDIMLRFLPCYQVVESMRLGMTPKAAATDAIARIKAKFPASIGAVFAVNRSGSHAGACHGWTFQYSVRTPAMADAQVFTVLPDLPTVID